MRFRILSVFSILAVLVWLLLFIHKTTPVQPTASPNARLTEPTKQAASPTAQTADSAQRIPPASTAAQAMPRRGANFSRQYGQAELRELTEDAKNKPAVVLASPPDDQRLTLLPDEIDQHTLTARRMQLNLQELDKIVLGQTANIEAPLPDGNSLLLQIDTVKIRASASKTLFGKIKGQAASSDVLIVYHDDIIHATIAQYDRNRHFEYRVLASGYLMVREIDTASMTASCGDPYAGSTQAQQPTNTESGDSAADEGFETTEMIPTEASVASENPDYTTIDVVVGYGIEARQTDGGVSQIEARIIASVDRMNEAFSNSLIVDSEVVLLGTIEDPDYDFPGKSSGTMGSGDELGDLNSTTDGDLDTVSDYANLLGADFKSFVVKQADGSAGVAYRPGSSSIVARNYMSSSRITFVHELGHNIGCKHSWGDSSSDKSVLLSNYGWRLDPPASQKVRTIMAYDWSWSRIPYFSNPDVEYLNARTGQVDGYNVTGDVESDPRYLAFGYSQDGSLTSGFDGTNPDLGANNAEYILSMIDYAANRRTRTAFNVTSPAPDTVWNQGTSHSITWTGGDNTDAVRIDLYKNDLFQFTIDADLTGENKAYPWEIPTDLTADDDYSILVSLNDTLTVESGNLTINFPPATELEATPTGAAQIELSWSDQASGESNYSVQKASDPNGPWTTLPALPANTVIYLDTGNTANTAYYYQVYPSNANLAANPSEPADATTWSWGEDWRFAYFGTLDNTGNAADSFDFDQDGLINLLERGFATDPTDSSDYRQPASAIMQVASDDYFTITYQRVKDGTGTSGVDYNAKGISYRVEVSSDLTQAWNQGDPWVEEIIPLSGRPDNGDGTETVTLRSEISIADAPAQFMQLSVESNE